MHDHRNLCRFEVAVMKRHGRDFKPFEHEFKVRENKSGQQWADDVRIIQISSTLVYEPRTNRPVTRMRLTSRDLKNNCFLFQYFQGRSVGQTVRILKTFFFQPNILTNDILYWECLFLYGSRTQYRGIIIRVSKIRDGLLADYVRASKF